MRRVLRGVAFQLKGAVSIVRRLASWPRSSNHGQFDIGTARNVERRPYVRTPSLCTDELGGICTERFPSSALAVARMRRGEDLNE